MDTSSPIIWVVLGLVLIIVEMFSLSLVLLFFGVAALVVAVLKYAGLNNLPIEILAFAILGIAGLLLFRSKLRRSLKSQPDHSIDRNRPIILSVDVPARGSAGIEYQGVLWTAVNASDAPMKKGDQVFIQSTEGVKLIIRKEASL